MPIKKTPDEPVRVGTPATLRRGRRGPHDRPVITSVEPSRPPRRAPVKKEHDAGLIAGLPAGLTGLIAPGVWQDMPSHATALSAANLNALESRMGSYTDWEAAATTATVEAYTDTQVALLGASLPTGSDWKGTYNGAIGYSLGDAVAGSDGHNYISLVAGVGTNTGNDPTIDGGVHWKDLVPPGMVQAVQSDALGRTQILGSSSIQAPALEQMISASDAPFNAKGDTHVVMDGSITSGSNVVTSPTALFKVNQCVQVVGAGPTINPGGGTATASGVLVGFVQSVGTGTATLVTTLGGSTAANASATIASLGTVKYGTDDSVSVQAMITALSNTGGGHGVLPPSRQYQLGNIVPANGVHLWCFGATLHLQYGTTNHSMFDTQTSIVGIFGFGIHGGTYPGTGLEQSNQSILLVRNSGNFCEDTLIEQIYVTNWATGPLYLRNPNRARVLYTSMFNVCTLAGNNAINFVFSGSVSGTTSATDIWAIGNFVANCRTIAVNVVFAPPSTYSTPPCNLNTIFIENDLQCGTAASPLSTAATVLEAEFSTLGTGEFARIVIANNHVELWSIYPAQSALQVDVNPTKNISPYFLSRTIIQGNTVASNMAGILCRGSDSTVIGNVVVAAVGPALTVQGVGVLLAQGTLTLGSTTVTSVTNGALAVNGSPINDNSVRISTGTYIVSGAQTSIDSGDGTTTWILSQPAIGSATQGLTVYSQIRNVIASNNVLRVSNAATGGGVWLSGLRNSTFSGNRIQFDLGSTSTAVGNDGIYVTFTGWMRITDNTIERAPLDGIRIQSSNDYEISRNRILNPSEAAASSNGITITQIDGTIHRVEGNIIVDDRATHLMKYGVQASVTVTPNGAAVVELLRNEIRGAVTAPALGTFATGKGNITDQVSGDANYITATNATWPIPPGATLLRVTCVGGGGGGGGGGTLNTVTISTTLTNGSLSGTTLAISSTGGLLQAIPSAGTITVSDGAGHTQAFTLTAAAAIAATSVTITSASVTLNTGSGYAAYGTAWVQVGGAGGSSSSTQVRAVPVGTATTLVVTIGAGGTSGGGGAAGGALGANGGSGGDTTVTGTGISVEGRGGGGGAGGAASSAVAAGGAAWGGKGGGQRLGTTIPTGAGDGGAASLTTGGGGGDPVFGAGGGGSGGAPANLTNGGLGGVAGTFLIGGTSIVGAGGAGTAAGVAGTSAAANTGAGGGGGGGGALVTGTGGAGGVGGSGYVVIEVLA